MPNNDEEQKPVRKTWLMIKKPKLDNIVEFNTNIIPKFDGANEITDKWGVWKLSSTEANNNNFIYENIWNIADKNEDTNCRLRYKNKGMTGIVDLILPEGVAICPKQVGITMASECIGEYFYGYNPDKKVWEQLLNSDDFGLNNKIMSIPNPMINTDIFFTKFRWDTRAITKDFTYIAEIKILQGIIKKI